MTSFPSALNFAKNFSTDTKKYRYSLKYLPIIETSPSTFDKYDINKNKAFLIDKIKHIQDLLLCDSSNLLFTRPSRMGKTMMLNNTREIYQGNNDLLEGTSISVDKTFKEEAGKYPVIFPETPINPKAKNLRTTME